MSIENLENIDICVIVLLVLLILAILIILYLYSKYKKLKAKYNMFKRENYELDRQYQDQLRENNRLNNNIGKKKLEINELNKLVDKYKTSANETIPKTDAIPSESSGNESVAPKTNTEAQKDIPKETTMYASFPRSAGSSVYFSDLTEIIGDDSYFELKISKDKGTATFRPLDFMKIRNYDPAMIAMQTEGVKPNVASTVLGIENGKAHKEGSDWIIDNPAKIKLA